MNKITTLKKRINTIDTRRGCLAATKRIRGGSLRIIRARIGLRDDYSCQVCGRVTAKGEVDHKIPLHLGGGNNDENLWWLCRRCHGLKTESEHKGRGGVI